MLLPDVLFRIFCESMRYFEASFRASVHNIFQSTKTKEKRKMKRLLAITLGAIMIFALLAGCGSTSTPTAAPTSAPTASPTVAPTPAPTPQPTPEPVELYISAAASLTDVIEEIAEEYKAVAPHVTLTCTFASSGALQTQIEEGAPADIFLSAAQKQMDALSDGGLIVEDTRKDLLVNKVVLIVPGDSDADITSFEDVTTDKVTMVAIGEETVPVGQYTQEIYTSLGTWEEVKAKANLGADVRAVLTWVESGDVDCGIVYATDAASTDGVKVVCEAPEDSHKPVIYPGAVIDASENQEEAQAFLDFLTSDIAIAAFEKAGFTMA